MSTQIVSIATLGISGTLAVVVNMGEITPTEPRNTVLLGQQYIMLEPPGFPSRPPAGAAIIQEVGTFASGTTITVFDFEANAIVGAGGGTITGTFQP